jgi:hypothetical protein
MVNHRYRQCSPFLNSPVRHSTSTIDVFLTHKDLLATVVKLLEYAHWLEEADPGFLALVILTETGEDYRDRDIVSQVARLIELFGTDGVALILGCP